MAITKPARKAAEAFIEAAPDAKPTRWQRGSRTQVTISLAPELLDQLDQIATRKHLNRSAMLTVLIGEALAREERAAA
jgi:hypothetical protein